MPDLPDKLASAKEGSRLVYLNDVLTVAENVCFRPTQDARVKDGRVRCSVDDLLVRLAAIKSPDLRALQKGNGHE